MLHNENDIKIVFRKGVHILYHEALDIPVKPETSNLVRSKVNPNTEFDMLNTEIANSVSFQEVNISLLPFIIVTLFC
jgi:hypothetical protein